MANVTHRHPAIVNMFPTYELIDHCISGEVAVKAAGTVYLPIPNAGDTSDENLLRYSAYKTRAVWYNVTGRTLKGLVGQVFLRDPVIEVPKVLDVVIKDADGSGTSVIQLADEAVSYVLSKGRCGLLADFPETNGAPTTRAQQLSGDVRPTLTLYGPTNVINWRTITKGGRSLVSLVVLYEKYAEDDDGFEETLADQYRVLKLDASGNYVVELWRRPAAGGDDFSVSRSFTPLDGKGKPLTEIPFRFIGVLNNNPAVDPAPLYDLASINLAHFRNSADYEESVFIVGQPTPVITGLTEEWVKNVFADGKVEFGSRAAISLPVGGDAKLLEAEPNKLAFEAMTHKEKQMVALGAKLIENKEVQRTATEADQEEASENSVLASAAKNVGEAFKWCLEWCAIFADAATVRSDAKNKQLVTFTLNTDFALSHLSPDDQRAVIEAWQNRAITFEEMRALLRRGGVATLDDKKALADIAKEIANAPELDLKSEDDNQNPPTKKVPGNEPEPEPAS